MAFSFIILRLVFFSALMAISFVFGDAESEVCSITDHKICLNMIVKDEEKVMPRLIESVKDIIDYYVIVDTGSTDSTVELIPKEMKKYGIEGQVHRREWVNFGVNRQQALELAMENCDSIWALFIDADDQLVVLEDAKEIVQRLDPKISYEMEKRSAGTRYPLKNLINIHMSKSWYWEGVVHEFVDMTEEPEDHDFKILESMYIQVNIGEGARSLGISQQQKFLKDARLLEEELERNPTDSRSMYYLGQSYRDAGQMEKARETFLKRVEMGDWDQEQFWAKFQAAVATEILEPDNEDRVVRDYLDTYQLRPTRIEPLFNLAEYYLKREELAKSYIFASIGSKMKMTDDILFVYSAAYEWEVMDILCVVAFYADSFAEGFRACSSLIEKAEEFEFSAEQVERYQKNKEIYQQGL